MGLTNHKNVRKNVLELVKNFPETAENYNQLAYYYWVLYDNCKDFADIRYCTPVETITRHLRRLVYEGAVEPPERVLKARKAKELEFRTEFSALT